MAEDDGQVEVLAALDFFSGCTPAQLRDIAHLTDERTLAPGDELCRQGDFENEVYVVVEGRAEVQVDGAVVGTTRHGEIVGELSMLGNGLRAATLRVVEEMRVLVLDPREIDSVLAADPSSAGRLTRHGTDADAAPKSS